MYDYMPDSVDAKQDLESVVRAGMNRVMKEGEMKHFLEVGRHALIGRLDSIGDPQATAIARELERLVQYPVYEQQWLATFRPGVLDGDYIKSRKELYLLKETVRSRVSDEKLTRINACPSINCRRFMADYALAEKYERQNLPGLALEPATRWHRLLDTAYLEAMEWRAQQEGAGSGVLPAKLMDMLRTTTSVYEPQTSSGGEPYDHVNPIDIKTISEQVQAIKASGEDYGFVGVIDAVEPIKAFEIVSDDTLVVLGKSGIATYDLKTGKRHHLLYDLPPDIELSTVEVANDAMQAYVVTNLPSLVRYDLVAGKQDTSFVAPEILREDAKIAVSPDGKTLAMAHFGTIHLYDTKSGNKTREFRSHGNLLIYGLLFTSTSRSMIVYGNGPVCYEYDLRDGSRTDERRIVPEKESAYIYNMCRSGGMLVASGLGSIAVWPENSTNPKLQVAISGDRAAARCRFASIVPDEQHLVCSHGLWSMNTGEPVVRFLPRWNPGAMAMTPDGSRIVIGVEKSIFVVPTCLERAKEESKPALELRTWTDKTGKFKIKATLVAVASGKATLQKTDGSQVQVPLPMLSDSDQQFLRERDNEQSQSNPKTTVDH